MDSTTISKYLISAIACTLLCVGGCSRTTTREIGEKYKPEIENKIAELRAVAEALPQREFDPDAKLDAGPYMHVADPQSNTAMDSLENFLGIRKRTEDPTYFDMYTYAFSNLLEQRFAAQPAEKSFESEIKSFLDLRYAIVYHPVDYHQATITKEEFSIEPLKMIVALYDLKQQKWIFSKSFILSPPDKINFTYREGQKESYAVFTVKEHFIQTVKPLIVEYVKTHLGGTIEFDHDAIRNDGTKRFAF